MWSGTENRGGGNQGGPNKNQTPRISHRTQEHNFLHLYLVYPCTCSCVPTDCMSTDCSFCKPVSWCKHCQCRITISYNQSLKILVAQKYLQAMLSTADKSRLVTYTVPALSPFKCTTALVFFPATAKLSPIQGSRVYTVHKPRSAVGTSRYV